MKFTVQSGAVALSIACSSVVSSAAGDPRFFGTYCGGHSERHGLRTYTFNVRASSDYRETVHGNGLVTGQGTITGEGRTIPFVFSGAVMGRGHLKGSGIVGAMEPVSAAADLSDDGNAVTLRAMNRTFSLKKDGCGNAPPAATIRNPGGGTFPWGDILSLSATATDREDASFSQARLVWTSSRDGRLGTGLSIWENDLSSGRHTITFTATDSGGRTASDSVVVQISNHAPNRPAIEEPSSGATFYSGQEIAFRARASDREDGYLSGGSLVWSSDRSGRLGTGDLLRAPVTGLGNHVITLAATDAAGASNTASVRITIRQRPQGNTPPTVSIAYPADYFAMGDDTCVTLISEASDLEDGRLRGRSLVWTDGYRDGGTERVRDLGTGTRVDFCNPAAAGGDTRHVISVKAMDDGGLEATNSIVIIAIPGGLI